jgi:hypothetical protein
MDASSTSRPPTSRGIRGTFRERQLDAGQTFRNTYEQTKWEAEHVVNDASRPSPADRAPVDRDGRVDSGWTPAFNVLYWPLRAFSRGLFSEVPGAPERHVDVVPVDYVADALVHLLEHDESGVREPGRGREAATVDELIDSARRAFGSERPPVVPPGSTGTGSRTPTTRRGLLPVLRHGRSSSTTPAPASSCTRPASAARSCRGLFPGPDGYAARARWGKTRSRARRRRRSPRSPR